MRTAEVHVPSSGDARKATRLSERDLAHRESFVRYVLEDAEEWHREHLGALYSLWREWNEEHYDGQLVEPYIMLNEPSNPRRLGDCGGVSGFGGRSQIRIRPSLLTGTHPRMRLGAHFAEGRFRYVADVLLHEMIHQWQHEVVGNSEESYHGHGTIFRDKANEIGAKLGTTGVPFGSEEMESLVAARLKQLSASGRPADRMSVIRELVNSGRVKTQGPGGGTRMSTPTAEV